MNKKYYFYKVTEIYDGFENKKAGVLCRDADVPKGNVKRDILGYEDRLEEGFKYEISALQEISHKEYIVLAMFL